MSNSSQPHVSHALKHVASLVVMACGISWGCAHTTFYSDANLKTETGFRYYTGKPYLLVANTGAKDKPTDISIVYLPDLEHPLYAVQKAGWGTSEFTVTISNGTVASFGQKVDSKGPEALTALAGIATSAGGLVKALADAEKTRTEAKHLQEQAASMKDRRDAANILRSVSETLQQRYLESALPTAGQTTKAKQVLAQLSGLVAVLEDPKTIAVDDVAKGIASVLKEWDVLLLPDAPASADVQKLNGIVTALKGELQRALKLLTPEEAPKPSYELYEIREEGGKTTLVRVLAQP